MTKISHQKKELWPKHMIIHTFKPKLFIDWKKLQLPKVKTIYKKIYKKYRSQCSMWKSQQISNSYKGQISNFEYS